MKTSEMFGWFTLFFVVLSVGITTGAYGAARHSQQAYVELLATNAALSQRVNELEHAQRVK